MTGLRAFRRTLLILAAIVALVLGVLTFAVHDAKARILQALGPRATVGTISLSYPQVTLHDVRIAADATPGAWPSGEEFHASLVQVRIDVGSLWAFRHGAPLVISEVRVEDGTLAMLRTRGHLTLLPALRETARARASDMAASAPAHDRGIVPAAHAAAVTPKLEAATPTNAADDRDATPVRTTSLIVRHAHVERMAVDLFDATLPGPGPHRLRFEQVHGDVEDIALPALTEAIAVDLAGALKGVERDGAVTVKGRFTPASHDADLALRGTNIDMIALQPYLLRFGEGSVRHGRLDMQIDAHVVQRQLDAPGHLVLSGLEFGEGGGTFAGAERRAVLAALSRDGRIDMTFTLVGRTDDPRFSLDESLATRIAAGMGQAVGVSVKGIVDGVGDALKGLLGGSGKQ